jgi:hypothetical protein
MGEVIFVGHKASYYPAPRTELYIRPCDIKRRYSPAGKHVEDQAGNERKGRTSESLAPPSP